MKYIKFDILDKYGYTAIHTTKNAGNMRNINNRQNLLKEMNISNYKIANAIQTHSNNILCVKEDTNLDNLENIDGFISNIDNLAIITYYADCLPIFLVDKNNKAYGLIHSGWRGSSNKIIYDAIDIMINEYKCNIDDIIIVLGVGISAKNYEIKQDTIDTLNKKLDFNNMILYNENKAYLDNSLLNKMLAIKKGIKEENIYINNYCTFDDNFYSYRRDKTDSRNAAIIFRRGKHEK